MDKGRGWERAQSRGGNPEPVPLCPPRAVPTGAPPAAGRAQNWATAETGAGSGGGGEKEEAGKGGLPRAVPVPPPAAPPRYSAVRLRAAVPGAASKQRDAALPFLGRFLRGGEGEGEVRYRENRTEPHRERSGSRPRAEAAFPPEKEGGGNRDGDCGKVRGEERGTDGAGRRRRRREGKGGGEEGGSPAGPNRRPRRYRPPRSAPPAAPPPPDPRTWQRRCGPGSRGAGREAAPHGAVLPSGPGRRAEPNRTGPSGAGQEAPRAAGRSPPRPPPRVTAVASPGAAAASARGGRAPTWGGISAPGGVGEGGGESPTWGRRLPPPSTGNGSSGSPLTSPAPTAGGGGEAGGGTEGRPGAEPRSDPSLWGGGVSAPGGVWASRSAYLWAVPVLVPVPQGRAGARGLA